MILFGKTMRKRTRVIGSAVLIFVTILAVFIYSPPARRTIPGQIIRWCFGEPGATQGVNDAADIIRSAGWEHDLMELSDSLTVEFRAMATNSLPSSFMGGFLISIERLPDRYRQLGGTYSQMGIEPEFAFRPEDDWGPDRIVMDWAHMRHAVIIYSERPPKSPTGFHVRRVSDRIYVVANES
jgi:hypothetical protein